jgi:hypothetical protein
MSAFVLLLCIEPKPPTKCSNTTVVHFLSEIAIENFLMLTDMACLYYGTQSRLQMKYGIGRDYSGGGCDSFISRSQLEMHRYIYDFVHSKNDGVDSYKS